MTLNATPKVIQESRQFTDGLVDSLGAWVGEWMHHKWSVYLISFMFSPILGLEGTRLCIMTREIEAFYSKFVTRVVRRPTAAANAGKLPILIGHPDRPVSKRSKISLSDASINDGLHFHGVLGLPPVHRMEGELAHHIELNHQLYVPQGGVLERIHVAVLRETPGKAVRYTMKMAERQRYGLEHLVILPRSRSEL